MDKMKWMNGRNGMNEWIYRMKWYEWIEENDWIYGWNGLNE